MKTKLAGLLGLLIGISSQAQLLFPIAITNTIAAVTTVTANVAVATGKAKDIAIGFDYVLASATGTDSNLTATVQKSIDGTNWVNFATMALLSSDTTRVTFPTNFSVGAIPWLRISTVANASTVAVQTLNFWVVRKD